MKILENGKYVVQYIDYGNVADILPADMMQFPQIMLHRPSIAHVCSVKGIFQLFPSSSQEKKKPKSEKGKESPIFS